MIYDEFKEAASLLARTWIAGAVCRHDIHYRNCGLCMTDKIGEQIRIAYETGYRSGAEAAVKVCEQYPAGIALESMEIVEGLTVSLPDVKDGNDIWCAVCDTKLHLGWPSFAEHRDDCPWVRAVELVEASIAKDRRP